MAYITLDELKEILPIILERWIDEDDESWEWIFQEIEQKCHIGTKCKGKKWKKHIEDNVCILKSNICDLIDWHNDLVKRVDDVSNKYSVLNDRYTAITSKINRMDNDITAAKSMAQTAKQRTEVDYTQMSKVKSDAEVIQDVYNRMAGRGATKEELDTFRNLIHKYDALEKKEIPIINLTCETCKYNGRDEHSPCISCKLWNKWEAKENG